MSSEQFPVDIKDMEPKAQAEAARELTDLPLRGDTVHGLFGGRIESAKVGDHRIDTNGDTKIELTSEETGESTWAHIKALSPEVQSMMEADKGTRNAKMGEKTLDVVDVHEPDTAEAVTEIAEDTGKYDSLVRGEVEGSVEEAAVRPVETADEKSLREWRERDSRDAQAAQIKTAADFYRAGHK